MKIPVPEELRSLPGPTRNAVMAIALAIAKGVQKARKEAAEKAPLNEAPPEQREVQQQEQAPENWQI